MPKTENPTIIIVPRERASVAVDSLKSIYEGTDPPFDLVYIDCLLYGSYRRDVQRLVEEHGHRYVRVNKRLYPNEARNLGAELVDSGDLIFVDNDIFVREGWLKALVACAAETGAGVVGPLYLEGDEENLFVHCAGGRIDYEERDGGVQQLFVCQNELHTPLAKMPPMTRTPTGLVEFHMVFVSRDCFVAMNSTFDDKLQTTREHVDLCMTAKQAGFDVYFQPECTALYAKTAPPTFRDLGYFFFRWSDKATIRTIAHFEDKWSVKLDPQRRSIIRNRRRQIIADTIEGLPVVGALLSLTMGKRSIKRIAKLLELVAC